MAHWKGFVEKHFTETGSFIHVVWSATSERTKMFEIVYAAMPRYFYSQFHTDVENLQITLDGAVEKATPTESKVTCDRAKFIYTYRNQCQVRYNITRVHQSLLTCLGRLRGKTNGILGRVGQDGVVTVRNELPPPVYSS